jgi:transglutaminase-like putative cysteine protease
VKKLDPNLGVIDHVLAALACLLAVYSIGMSLNNTELAVFFTVAITLAATTGYALSRLVKGKRIAALDSYLWAVSGVASVGLVNVLNGILPGGGFPFELLAAGILCWVLLFGNLFAWRDQTLIFLSLPCIAIFGLVGTFDTFAAATVLFFVFMLTIALLYARIHQRSMIERAKRSGAETLELLRRGPWKWMAGPEWALASALAIILFSFVGAPVLRSTLDGVAGKVSVSLPQQRRQQQQQQQAAAASDVNVGTGPAILTDLLVTRVRIDKPRYLRLNSFSAYTGGGWSTTRISLPAGTPLVEHSPTDQPTAIGPNGGFLTWPGYPLPPFEPIQNGRVIPLTLKDSNNENNSFIAPGPIVEIEGNPEDYTFLAAGWVYLEDPLARSAVVTAHALVPTESPADRKAVLPPALAPLDGVYRSKQNIASKVRDLAYRATEGAQSDFAKALAIKSAIEQRVRYNIKAPQTPQGKDPVEYFLFESNEGYCDLFASAMVLMARSAGLPARYVTGYIINDNKRDAEGFYTIRMRDYHAWCEIYFEGVGWVPFDPTEGAPSVGEGVGSTGETAWYRSEGFRNALIALVVVALLFPVYMAAKQRGVVVDGRSERVASEVARLHALFNRAIERHSGMPKRFSQTTREFVSAAGPRLGEAKPTAEGLVGTLEAAMYSSRQLDKEGLVALGKSVSDLRAALGRMKKQRA